MLVETLGRETRVAHDAIEAAVEIERHLVDVEAYRALLVRFHGFHRGFEEARDLAGAGLDPALVPHASRADLIEQDLRALGMTGGAQASLPLVRLVYTDRPSLLGAIYVVEGSSLGGVLIARMAADRLGLGPDTGTAFFTGDGRDTTRRWRAVVAALDGSADPATLAVSVQSARATFAAMQDWLAPSANRVAAE